MVAADSTPEMEAADSEPVATPSQENKAAMAELFGDPRDGQRLCGQDSRRGGDVVHWHVGSAILICAWTLCLS